MKLITLCLVLSGWEALVQGELISTTNKKGEYLKEIRQTTSAHMDQPWIQHNLDMKEYDSSKSELKQRNNNNGQNPSQLHLPNKDIFDQLNHYMVGSIEKSVQSLTGWDQTVQPITPGGRSDQDMNGQRGHFAEMKVKKELTFFVLLIILATLGALVTKIKIAIGMMFLKLVIGKLILLFMHLKHSKHHAGPLIKAYKTTTNEFHSHLGHEYKSKEFNDGQPFFPSPPEFYDNSMRK